jgi:hypothetical protein|tara:strand:- start:210 stop:368 length:159 start_codon:yes stop_codon:yes gene_type:complete
MYGKITAMSKNYLPVAQPCINSRRNSKPGHKHELLKKKEKVTKKKEEICAIN